MRFKTLTLFTTQLERQTAFYSEMLGLKIVEASHAYTYFRVGNTILKFVFRDNVKPYHYAFNIPANQIYGALHWLNKRTTILSYEGEEIQDFSGWNAEAIYFHDPDQNIGELIARKNLDNSSDHPFDQNQILEVSEMGIPTDNLRQVVQKLQEHTGLKIYDGSLVRFCAVGEETGLFICVDKNIKRWFPTDAEAFASDFMADIEHQGDNYLVRYESGHLNIQKMAVA